MDFKPYVKCLFSCIDEVLIAKDSSINHIIILPKSNIFYCRLIQKAVSEKYNGLLTSFMVGDGPEKRVVVCYEKQLVLQNLENSKREHLEKDLFLEENLSDDMPVEVLSEIFYSIGKGQIHVLKEFQLQELKKFMYHIIELSNIPKCYKTTHICDILRPIVPEDAYEIKWVDDHKLLLFIKNHVIIHNIISLKHDLVKARDFIDADKISLAKAEQILSDSALLIKKRPQTSNKLARRLIFGALGVKHETKK